jgi:hypothetical protein
MITYVETNTDDLQYHHVHLEFEKILYEFDINDICKPTRSYASSFFIMNQSII